MLKKWWDFIAKRGITKMEEETNDDLIYNIIFFLSRENEEDDESDLLRFLSEIESTCYNVTGESEEEAGRYMREAVCDFLSEEGYKIDPSGYEVTVFDGKKEYFLFGFNQN